MTHKHICAFRQCCSVPASVSISSWTNNTKASTNIPSPSPHRRRTWALRTGRRTSPPQPPIDAANRSTSRAYKSSLVVVLSAIAVTAVVAAVVMTFRHRSAAADRDDAPSAPSARTGGIWS